MDRYTAGTQDDSELGYLGPYGALVVPAPASGPGSWFVTVAGWDADTEQYRAGTDGPIFDSREEAMDEAQRICDWLREQRDQTNLIEVWAQMQQSMLERDHPELEPQNPYRWWK